MKKTILIADDIEANRYLLKSLLEGNGYGVTITPDGKQALEAARKNPPDMIITDILMPEMDGFQLCKEWQGDENLVQIPFIFYTATYTNAKDKKYALSLGADRFVVKPQAPEVLLALVREVFEKPRQKVPQQHADDTEYSQILFRKLEQKVDDLEETRLRLEKEIQDRCSAEEESLQLEKQLRRAKKMESLGVLSSGVAHDFNNILQGIMGYAELVRDSIPADSTDVPEYLDEIVNGGVRAGELIQQILTFSREVKVGRISCRLSAVVTEALSLMKGGMPDGISMTTDIDPDCGLILADAGKIHQVVINFCSNAFDAMGSSGGTLKVSLKEECIEKEKAAGIRHLEPGRHVVLRVADNGPGMSSATLERIFEPYFTTKEANGGTGLGLAMVYGIIEAHDGAICVESTPGACTVFTVYFPVCEAADNGAELGAELKGNEELLLICRKSESSAWHPGLDLSILGYSVTHCSNAEAAVNIFREQASSFSAILIDNSNEGVNGAELAVQLKKLSENTPLIFYKSRADTPGAEQSFPLGVDFVESQPATLGALASKIRSSCNE